TSTQGIYATGSHKFIFSGDTLQTINIASGEHFATIELQNYSEEGVYSPSIFKKSTLIRNGCRLTYGDLEGEYGWTLEEDTVYEGDMVLIEDTLDLNGHSLTVTGDLIQLSGIVKVNGGSLTVEGDYRIQSRSGEEGAYTYSASSGQLQMVNEADYVLVKGSFISGTSANATGYLTAGILEVKGDVNVSSSYSSTGFVGTGSHTLRLSGEAKQTVSFGTWGSGSMRLQNLEITNESEEGVVISAKPYVSGHVKDHGNKVSGYIAIGTSTTFEEGYFVGSVYIGQSTTLDDVVTIGGDVYMTHATTISGSIHVKGNFEQHGLFGNSELRMEMGKLEIDGDYSVDSDGYTAVYMYHAEDYIHVHGNVSYNPEGRGSLFAGTFEVEGDLTSNQGINASGLHKFVFSGNSLQTIDIADSEYFATIELRNYSEEGIYSPTVFRKDKLIRNGCRLTIGDQKGEYGWTLQEDMVYEGDLVLIDDTLDLNGHSLTVTGDLVLIFGIVKVNGGSLTVEKDFRIQSRSGEEGAYTYSASSGQLQMVDEADYVLVKGNFISDTSVSGTGYLTAGILEVKGDVTVSNSYSTTGFMGTGSHTLLLSGNAEQIISFATCNEYGMRLQNLEITNESEEGVVIAAKPYVTGHVNDHGNKVSGYIAIGTGTTFEEGYFGGSIYIVRETWLKDMLTIGGDLEIKSYLYVPGKVYVAGNVTQTGAATDTAELHMRGGSLEIGGNYTVTSSVRSDLSMSYSSDYIYVHGDVSYAPHYEYALTAGTFEIGGDFTSTRGLNASGSHKFVFSGDSLQTISIAPNEYFATIELRNYSAEGVYSPTVFRRTTLIRNGCRLTYGDLEGEYGWILEEDTVYEGDLVLIEDTLDLNGHNLTVTGDLIQLSGKINVNGGALNILGDYRIQNSHTNNAGSVYESSNGQLIMQDANDRVTIQGDFIINNRITFYGNITAGIMELKGDFLQVGGDGYRASDDHTIIFSGDGIQTWSSDYYNSVNHVINRNNKKLLINATPVAWGTITDETGTISGNGYLQINSAKQIANNKWSGAVSITEEDTLASDLTVGTLMVGNRGKLHTAGHAIDAGSISLNGPLNVENAQIACTGDFTVNEGGTLQMQDADGYVLVVGNFVINSQYDHAGLLTDGVLELKGHFTQDSYVNFVATDNHTVILSKKMTTSGRNFVQNIFFGYSAGTTRFNRLIIKRSKDGYFFRNAVENIANEIVYGLEDETVPTPIGYLDATEITETSVTLSYGAAEDENGILGYEIYRDGNRVAISSETTFTDAGLLPGQVYTYTVYAFDTYKNLAQESPEVMATTLADTEDPTAPRNLSLYTRTGSSVTLKWNAATDNVAVTGYTVYRDGEAIATGLKELEYKDSGLEKNTVYRYYVTANDISGNVSAESNTVEAVVAMPAITSVSPTNYSKIGGNQVTLTL
ncbi:MAG: hypothetical protein IKL04_07315, partial [Lachnospiraceae bacterium]|nr:hypothetical protein [Lachnospiraceae bacterium]